MVVRATDTPADPSTALSSTANILIQVNDIQDQTPSFLNGPYSTTVPENTQPVISVQSKNYVSLVQRSQTQIETQTHFE